MWLNERLVQKKKLVSLGGYYGRIDLTLGISMGLGIEERYKDSFIPTSKFCLEFNRISSYLVYTNLSV